MTRGKWRKLYDIFLQKWESAGKPARSVNSLRDVLQCIVELDMSKEEFHAVMVEAGMTPYDEEEVQRSFLFLGGKTVKDPSPQKYSDSKRKWLAEQYRQRTGKPIDVGSDERAEWVEKQLALRHIETKTPQRNPTLDAEAITQLYRLKATHGVQDQHRTLPTVHLPGFLRNRSKLFWLWLIASIVTSPFLIGFFILGLGLIIGLIRWIAGMGQGEVVVREAPAPNGDVPERIDLPKAGAWAFPMHPIYWYFGVQYMTREGIVLGRRWPLIGESAEITSWKLITDFTGEQASVWQAITGARTFTIKSAGGDVDKFVMLTRDAARTRQWMFRQRDLLGATPKPPSAFPPGTGTLIEELTLLVHAGVQALQSKNSAPPQPPAT